MFRLRTSAGKWPRAGLRQLPPSPLSTHAPIASRDQVPYLPCFERALGVESQQVVRTKRTLLRLPQSRTQAHSRLSGSWFFESDYIESAMPLMKNQVH